MKMTQDLYQKAMKFAGEMHAKQTVPGTNANYLLHISNVAMEVILAHKMEGGFNLDLAMQIAILHDVMEDADVSSQTLEEKFGKEVADGVMALTKNGALGSKQEKMEDSLQRIERMPKEVGLVKLADRITNLQEPPSFWTSEKVNDYLEEAKLIYERLHHTNPYLAARLDNKIMKYATMYCSAVQSTSTVND